MYNYKLKQYRQVISDNVDEIIRLANESELRQWEAARDRFLAGPAIFTTIEQAADYYENTNFGVVIKYNDKGEVIK